MTNKELIADGILRSGDNKINVKVAYASRAALYADIPGNCNIAPGSEFEGLTIDVSGTSCEFGRCRLISAGGEKRYTGRLVFFEDVYDFQSLFFEKKIVNLDSLYSNLSLIFLQKENIKEEFIKYISGLTYDLRVYKNFFDEIDERYLNGDPESDDIVFHAVVKSEGAKFFDFFDGKLKELEQLIAGYSREENRTHGFFLRKQLWDIILCSEFLTHCNLKPRGYAGDSELMRMIYENDYRGTSTFGKLLYKYSLNHPGAAAVRCRKIMIPQYLKNVCDNLTGKSDEVVKFMSVACGPAYELSHLFTSPEDADKYQCTLLDQDHEALTEAEDNIISIEKKLGHKLKVRYIEDSVRTMLRTPDLAANWGQFHFIYSMGLFDYLIPTVAKAVIEKIYDLLLPGGELLIGNYHHDNASKWFMEYWHDWVLYYRSEDEFMELLAETDAVDVSVKFDETGTQMFLSAKKPLGAEK